MGAQVCRGRVIGQLLVLIGFSEVDADPLARLLQQYPGFAAICRELSLNVYLLHYPILTLCSPPLKALGMGFIITALLLLLLTAFASAAIVYAVQRPIARLMRASARSADVANIAASGEDAASTCHTR